LSRRGYARLATVLLGVLSVILLVKAALEPVCRAEGLVEGELGLLGSTMKFLGKPIRILGLEQVRLYVVAVGAYAVTLVASAVLALSSKHLWGLYRGLLIAMPPYAMTLLGVMRRLREACQRLDVDLASYATSAGVLHIGETTLKILLWEKTVLLVAATALAVAAALLSAIIEAREKMG
jgi:hypothetical protein